MQHQASLPTSDRYTIYEQILANPEYGCVFPCHDAYARGGFSLFDGETAPDLTDDNISHAYEILLNSLGSTGPDVQCAGMPCAVPGDAAASLLFQKITDSPKAICGSMMPLGARPRVGEEDVALLRAWINSGARLGPNQGI